jgi:hypothetical protein
VRDEDIEGSAEMSALAPQSTEHTLPILATRSYRDWSKDTSPYDIFHADNSVDDLPHLLTGLSLISSIENDRSQKTTTPLKIPPSASTCHDFPGKVEDYAGNGEFNSTHEENLPSIHTAGLETSVGEGSTKPEDSVLTSPSRNSSEEYNSLNEGVKREENSQPTSPSVTSFGSYEILDLDDSDNGVKTHTPGGTQKKRKMSGDCAKQSGSDSNEQSPNGNGYDSPDEHSLRGGGGGRRRKGKEVGGPGLLSDKRFACPYFKHDPVRYRRCETWSCSEKHRVR